MAVLSVDLESLKKIMCDLDYLVVSLDRIGSAQLTQDERMVVHDRFMDESNLTRRLLFIRKILSVAIDKSALPAELAEIDKAVEKVQWWDIRSALGKK